jgi:RimJ/RimL family protein N-acetyltransferase
VEAISTPRLWLQPLTIEDAPAIQRAFPHWEVVRWMDAAVPWPYPADGAEGYLTHVALPAMAAGKAWHWSLRPREDADRLIGLVSLMDQPDDNRGFWLDTAWQGRGLMTEASDAVTDFWFESLDKDVLRVPKAVANPASRRISEKRGMRVISRFAKTLVSGVHDVELWEITREEWRARRGQAEGQ